MTKGNFIKMSGGVVIMFSVFLFLATSKQVAKNGPEIKTFLLGNNKTAQTTTIQTQALTDNVTQGVFELNTSKDDKFIYSEKLKNQNTDPVLKVEFSSAGRKGWKKIEWHTLNYQEGTLYFNLPGENNIYTGRYQLVFN